MNSIPPFDITQIPHESAKNSQRRTYISDVWFLEKADPRTACYSIINSIICLNQLRAQYGFYIVAGEQDFTDEESQHIGSFLPGRWEEVRESDDPDFNADIDYWLGRDSQGRYRIEKFSPAAHNYIMLHFYHRGVENYIKQHTT